jgi:glycosyltransferase involved in cell wall biosynthesis
MRILMVTPQLPSQGRPGTLAPTVRQIESLRARGADVDVLEVRGIKYLKYLQSLGSLWSVARSVDLIHAHFGYCGWIARSNLRKPVVISFMGDDLLGTPDSTGRVSTASSLVVQIDRWVARTADAVIVKSAEMARIVAPVRAHVIPNGVDLQVFSPVDPAEARTALGWPRDRRDVLFAGNPETPRKGYPLARAAAMDAAARRGEPVELVPLAGVAPNRVPLYMNACDALLMTSFLEGSPNVVKEAMACNLPVVSVPVGDVPELLAAVDGCSVRPRDPRDLGEALGQVLQRGGRIGGRAALQRKGLDLASVADRVLAVYHDVLGWRRRCAA